MHLHIQMQQVKSSIPGIDHLTQKQKLASSTSQACKVSRLKNSTWHARGHHCKENHCYVQVPELRRTKLVASQHNCTWPYKGAGVNETSAHRLKDARATNADAGRGQHA